MCTHARATSAHICHHAEELLVALSIKSNDGVIQSCNHLECVPVRPPLNPTVLQLYTHTFVQAVDMFLAIIGAEAGAMALRCLARGGVFIAGGIVPRLLNRVTKTGVLRDAFINRTARERFQYLLRSMPLYVVTNTRVGIIGSR